MLLAHCTQVSPTDFHYIKEQCVYVLLEVVWWWNGIMQLPL